MVEYQLRNSAYTLTEKQITALIDNTRLFRDRLILKILAGTGIRREELVNLRVANIRWGDRLLWVEGKGDKVRIVPFSQAVANDLKYWLQGRKTGFVFPARLRRKAGLAVKQINKICASSGDRAGIKNPNPRRRHVNPHIFRHSYARIMKDRGMSFETLQNILGHASFIYTLDFYGTKSLDDIKSDFAQAVFI